MELSAEALVEGLSEDTAERLAIDVDPAPDRLPKGHEPRHRSAVHRHVNVSPASTARSTAEMLLRRAR